MPSTEVLTKSTKKFVPVSLSADFGKVVQEAAANEHRSLAQQLEFWALLGQKLASVFPTAALTELKSAAKPAHVVEALNHLVLMEGSAKVRAHLAKLVGPLYEAHPQRGDLVVAVYPDGSKVTGAVDVNGVFMPLVHAALEPCVSGDSSEFAKQATGVWYDAQAEKPAPPAAKANSGKSRTKPKLRVGGTPSALTTG